MAFYDVSTSEKKASPSLVAGGTLYADSPIGTILPYGGASAPSGWFLCDGTAVSRTTYSELFAVIGTAFGSGDGSTTFNLPDMREVVPVGIGQNGTQTIETHDVYTLAQFKDDQLQDHQHTITPHVPVAHGEYSTAFSYDTPEGAGGTVAVGRTGTTTHGKRLGVNYIIKAKMIGVPADFMSKVDEAVGSVIAPRTINCRDLLSDVNLSEARTATVDSNGFLVVNIEKNSGTAGNTVRLKVNNVYAQWVPFWGTNYGTTLCAFVRSGDEIEISADGDGSNFRIASSILQRISWT